MGLATATLVIGVRPEELSAADAWIEELQTGLFQIRSEFSLSDSSSQRLLGEINRLHADLETSLKLQIPERPVQVNLFGGRWSYSRYVAARVPEGASQPALYVQGPDMGHVFIYRRWGFETDLRHECTHALLHNALPYVPLWLDEGLAEYFEVPGQDRSSRHPHLGSLRRAVLFGWKPDLRRLERLRSMGELGSREYQESWAWVHYLLHGPPEIQLVLSSYLQDIQRGEYTGPLSDRLFSIQPHAEAALVDHLRRWR